MGRKIRINTYNSIGTWVAKNNLMAGYVGDLDSLDPHFALSDDDSSIVSAINHLHDEIDSVNNLLFNPGGTLSIDQLNTRVLTVTDSLNTGYLRADSAHIDSAFIKNISGSFLHYDSGEFHRLRIDDSLSGGFINADSGRIDSISGIFANYSTIKTSNLLVDSADITVLSTSVFTANTFNMQGVLNIDSVGIRAAKEFTIQDVNGTIVFGGYLLSTTDSVGVA